MKVLQVTFLSALVLELLATLSTAVVAVQIGLRLLYFQVSLEQALFLLIIAPEFYIPLRLLGLRFHAGMEGQSAAERIFQILESEPLSKQTDNQDLQKTSFDEVQELTFKDVSFSYPGGRGIAINGVSFQIKRGEQIALVGASGAGKSTLASLLMGFFPPGAGEIFINDIKLDNLDLEVWRERIAWVPQKPSLFQGTIAANIRLARPDASDSAVAAAASAAHLADFIESLPEGYQTQIGEGGARLSGGQAQRLALARAFLKDAPLLILDEPTSQLDPVTESQLADATRALMAGRTVITIAHRLNTVFQADRILVLQAGEIIESGTHKELLAKGESYRELVQAYTGFQNIHNLGNAGDQWIRQRICSPVLSLRSSDRKSTTSSSRKRKRSIPAFIIFLQTPYPGSTCLCYARNPHYRVQCCFDGRFCLDHCHGSLTSQCGCTSGCHCRRAFLWHLPGSKPLF